MDDKKPAKEEAHRVGLDEPLCASTEIQNQEYGRAWKKLALFVIGLSVSGGAFAFDQVCWRASDTAGPIQIVDRQVPGCFPTAVAAEAAMLAKANELSHGFFPGYDGSTWSNAYSRTSGWGNCLEHVNPVNGERAYCSYQTIHTEVLNIDGSVHSFTTISAGLWFAVQATVCPPGRLYDATTGTCKAIYDVYHTHHHPNACLSTPHPIEPMTGSKTKEIRTGFVAGAQELTLTYDSINRPNFQLWNTNFHKSLNIQPTQISIVANRGSGVLYGYPGASSASNPCGTSTDDGGTASLSAISGGASYQYKDETARAIESYNSAGQLQTIVDAAGHVLTATYSDATTPAAIAPTAGYLLRLTDAEGRSVSFEYTLPAGAVAATGAVINKITDTTGNSILLAYDSNGMLISLTWPDGKARGFVYENAALPWALTGIVDENNSRFQTYDYSASGEATSSELAGGVDRYAVSYQAPMVADSVTEQIMGNIICRYHKVDVGGAGGMSITQPNGTVSTASMDTSLGYGQLAGLTQPAGSGCAASNNASAFDALGNILSQDDFQGQRTCYAYDAGNREITRVEGLANTVDCATVTPANAVLAAGARKISTSWHPDWRIPTVVSAPGSITTSIYHGQSDPFNGNAIANCTSAAVLPNGLPLPLICKQVTQATLANDALDAATANVVSRFSYDAAGRVLTSQDTLNRTTSYAYYPDTVINGVLIDDHVSLLLHGDGANASTTFTDNSLSPKAVTVVGNTQISTAQSKFGGSSISFNGSTDYLTVAPGPDFNFGVGPFTIEAWVLFNNVSGQQLVTSNYAGASAGWSLQLEGGRIVATMSGDGTDINGTSQIGAGVWHHIALSGQAGSIRLFVDGNPEGPTYTGPISMDTNVSLRIGSIVNVAFLNGYIDDLRITKGIARYTDNFTPPTAAFGNPGTVAASPSDTGHTRGDLQSITNALGHVTTFDLYDRAGRILQSTDSKGVVTTISYTPRGWVSSVTLTPAGMAARTTTYTYDGAGQLTGVTNPDGTTLAYAYDAAHRLVGATDAKGNSVAYTLDNVGNRITEQIKDPMGTLQRSISRSFDALNRLQQVTGSAQ